MRGLGFPQSRMLFSNMCNSCSLEIHSWYLWPWKSEIKVFSCRSHKFHNLMKHVPDLGFFFAVLLHCGQVRRLRIQQRMKSEEKGATAFDDNEEMLEYTSSIPLLPPLVWTDLNSSRGNMKRLTTMLLATPNYTHQLQCIKLLEAFFQVVSSMFFVNPFVTFLW